MKTIFLLRMLSAFLVAFVAVTSNAQEFEGETLSPVTTMPAPSPEGFRALFVSDVYGTNAIWMVDFVTGTVSLVLDFDTSSERDPDWMPDGNSFLFASNRDGSFDLWKSKLDAAEPQKLTDTAANEMHPRVSPDGSKVVYVSNATGKNELWVMDIDGQNAEPIALNSLRVNFPDWSPDGERIVYTGCSEASCNLFSVDSDGFGVQQITDGEFSDFSPDWGESGIIFSSDRSDDYTLWYVEPDGSSLQEFSADFDYAGSPRWIPFGGVIATRSVFTDMGEDMQIWSLAESGLSERLTQLSFVLPRPDDLAARAKRGKVSLVWSPVVGAESYTIYRATDAAGPDSIIADGHVTSYATYLDAAVSVGNTYFYSVTANFGGLESEHSNTVAISIDLRTR